MKEFVINSNEANQRFSKYLAKLMPNAQTSFIYKMLRKKNIKLNDKKAEGNEILSVGDVVKVFFSDETFDGFSGNVDSEIVEYTKAYETLKGIKVIYEDKDVVIFDKPSNVLSQKAKEADISINEYLTGYLLAKKEISTESLRTFKPSVVNRLDRNTKGLIIGAKTLFAKQELSYLIKERKIDKYYKAYVVGRLDKELMLEGFLVKDEDSNTVRVYDAEPKEKAYRIKTFVKPLAYEEGISETEVKLITGKSHQIRAHLSHAGFPILGDTKYGNQTVNKEKHVFEQKLISYKLIFPDDIKIDSLKGKTITLS